MQEGLHQEKELREKGVADPQIHQMREHLYNKNITTIWDIQDAYDADYFGLKDRCPFGSYGLCCRNCDMGPCRLLSEEMPEHVKAVSPGLNRSGCGKTKDSMVASMYLQTVIRGVSSHIGHAFHILRCFSKVAKGEISSYSIKDERKLKSVALNLGIRVEGKGKLEIAEEISEAAWDDLSGRQNEKPMRFAMALAPKNIEKLKDAKLVPTQGVAESIIQGVHSTAQGNTNSLFGLLHHSLFLAALDIVSLYISTELQDILFGSPSPKTSEIGLNVLKKDMVNIVVHGHLPLLSEKVVELAPGFKKDAEAAGAKGVNVVGICCSGNEILMRQGVPLAGSTIMQELVIGTGLVEAICVDVQCIYPSLSAIKKEFHTKLITTMPEGRMEGEQFIHFKEEEANEAAVKIIQEAISAYRNRNINKSFLPSTAPQTLVAGFSVESFMDILSKLDSKNPLFPLIDLIKSGGIKGVALLVGCLSPKVQTDMSHVSIAKEMIKNNVLVLATGCAATACGRHGLLNSQASKYAGLSLRKVLETLGEKAGLGMSLPPVLHFGSCVDNSRAVILASALADALGASLDQLPIVVSAAEQAVEKATAIYLGAAALGFTTHIGVVPKLGGSPFAVKVLTEDLEKISGGKIIIEVDPLGAARKMLEVIYSKRKNLGI